MRLKTVALIIVVLTVGLTNAHCRRVRIENLFDDYAETIVPVISIDGNYLFVDKKKSIYNTGGVFDNDDIWLSRRTKTGTWDFPQRLDSGFNSKYSDVLFSLSPDMSAALVYGIWDDKNGYMQDGFSFLCMDGLRIYGRIPLLIDGYKNYSTNFYATAFPDFDEIIVCVNPDGKNEGHDLLYSKYVDSSGIWSVPKNLTEVNSGFDEASPYMALDGRTLYFASRRPGGIGKYDLYMTRMLQGDSAVWEKPVNLGASVNTTEDETGICLNPLGDTAIIVSYDSSKGKKALFEVELPAEFRPRPYKIVEIKIFDDSCGTIVPFDKSLPCKTEYARKKKSLIAHSNSGVLHFVINPEDKVHLTILVPGFEPFEKDYECANPVKPIIEKSEVRLKRTLSEEIRTGNYYFDKDKYELSDDQYHRLLNDLKKYGSEYSITIKGYADTSGTEIHNELLSKKRAETAAKRLKSDTSFKLITTEYYGESVIVEGSDELNRRIEIILKK